MAHYALYIIVTMLIFCAPLSSWAQKYLLYSPQPVATKNLPPSQEGIIVQEIDIKKGDTLYNISRKYSGHGMYFPQILLFNSIRNPDLIYTGSKLKVPLTLRAGNDERPDSKPLDKSKATGTQKSRPEEKSVTPGRQSNASPLPPQNTEISLSELRTTETAKSSRKKKNSLPTRKIAVPELPPVTPLSAPLPASYSRQTSPAHTFEAVPVPGQKLFEAAVKAYRLDDCRTALELLDRYLAKNSDSPLAADANLYKAECYLKLSAQ